MTGQIEQRRPDIENQDSRTKERGQSDNMDDESSDNKNDEGRRIWTNGRTLQGLIAFCAAILGYLIGIRYLHLCSAGSTIIEYFAAFGTPVVCAGIVVFGRRHYVVAFLAIVLLLLVVYFGCQPYRDWVHGPNSPWPDVRD